jgi:hypothetical protein
VKSKIKAILSTVATLSSLTAFASGNPPVEIEVTDVDVNSNCTYDEFMVNSVADGFGNSVSVLEGLFTDMVAAAFADGPRIDKKNCRVRYNLHVPQGYKIVQMNFEATGVYSVSEGGNIRATIGHKVGAGNNRRVTIQRRGSFGDDQGDLSDLVNSDSFTNPIYGADLEPEFQRCGATIPVRTDLIIHASQSGMGDFSEVSLDSSDGSASSVQGPVSYKRVGFCKIKLVRCS